MTLLSHLQSLESAGLIELAAARPDLAYLFRHALLQEAVYRTLPKIARASLHGAVARAMAGLSNGALENRLGDLAFHYAQAGEWQPALDFAWRAGARAQAMYAPMEALAYFDRAVEAAGRLAAPVPAALLRARGQTHETLGQFELARADYQQALAQARAAGDQPAEWRSLLDLGFLWAARDYNQAGECFRAALGLARAMGDPASLGHSLNRLGNWHMNIEEIEIARQYHLEALAIFEALGDPHSLAQTLDLLGICSAILGDYAAANRYYPQAIALFRQVGDRPGLLSALTVYLLRTLNYETALLTNEDLSPAEIDQVEDEIVSTARAIGLRAAEAFGLLTLSTVYGPRGDYARALETGHAALAIAEDIQHHQWTSAAHYGLGALYLDVLALPQAGRHLEAGLALAQQTNTRIWINGNAGTLAHACAAQYQAEAPAGAPAWHTRPLAEWPPLLARAQAVLSLGPDPATPLRTGSEAILLHGRAQLALACGDAAGALAFAEQLQAYNDRLVSPPPVIPTLRLLRAESLAALGRAAEALAALDPAVERARRQGARAMLWRLQRARARALAALGQPAPAAAAQAEARALVIELAQGLPSGGLRESFMGRALV